ncbi:hypothetical protein KP79_PYT20966 [Mizuhopecten yessoensis]|uniref:Uncharacterized protein n=2 Tax=Mizuhopecten yessoensis TaxID=6573 RepID=A0A210R584_MIZYE|nr:hypothetical protein KP79_PYT20966 [Mizuhopecten yessoensis]
MDIQNVLGDVEMCKSVCLQTKVDTRKCWAVNMFSVLSNFCRLYYLHRKPPHLFYQRYVSSKPGPLFLRRRLSRHQIQDDHIVDNIEDLVVNPKNTTLYNLKFISVYENKPAKISMGVIGTIFIATGVIAIIILDCPLICKHVRTIAARNIRKRTVCKNKKMTKITKKKACNKVGQITSTETKDSVVKNKNISATPSKEVTSNKNTPPTEAEAHSSNQKDGDHDKVTIYHLS